MVRRNRGSSEDRLPGNMRLEGIRPGGRAWMKKRSSGDDDGMADPLESDLPRWCLWLTRVTLFAVIFVLLITAFAALGRIVEQFFVVLYAN